MSIWIFISNLEALSLWFLTFTPSERVALVAAFLVLVGVAGEYFVEIPEIEKRERLRKRIKHASMALLLFGLAGDVLGIIMGQIETEELHSENLKLEYLIQPRSLSLDQQRGIGTALSQFKNQKVLVTVENLSDPESYNFSQQVIGALKSGNLIAMEDNPNGPAATIRGTGVAIHWQNDQKPCADAIAEAFRTIGHVKNIKVLQGEPNARGMRPDDVPVTIGVSIFPKPFDVAE